MGLSTEHERLIRAEGEAIFNLMEKEQRSIFSRDWWYGQVLDWSMKNEEFKTQMFRFVDVLPSLSNSEEVATHLKEYFTTPDGKLPPIMSMGLGVGSLAPGLMAAAIKKNVTQMAKMFITGETPEEALPVIKKARKNGLCFTMDLLGEATLSEKEALEYQSKYISMIHWLAKESQSWSEISEIDRDHLGPLPKVNVSVKLSSIYSQINIRAFDQTKEVLKERLRPIFRASKEASAFLNVDMEQYEIKDLTLAVFEELILESEFRNYPYFGIVIQAYLRDAQNDIERLIEIAHQRAVSFTVRLVKGAYWDFENITAAQKRWPIPVFTKKGESDVSYETCAELLFSHFPAIGVALASHNVRSLSACFVLARKKNIPPRSFEVQMLYGMADPIKKAISKLGYRVREYAPVGEMIPGMAYLVRRLLENTSNESFLRSKFAEGSSIDELLKDPKQGLIPSTGLWPQTDIFHNEPLLDFKNLKNREKITQAINNYQLKEKRFSLWIDGKERVTPTFIASRNPSHPDHIIGRVCEAGIKETEEAILSAKNSFPVWSKTSVVERVKIIKKLANLIEENREELIACEILEVGKPWVEADGDITEAIDFCKYYSSEAQKLFQEKRVGQVLGETSIYHYQARGVTAVIAPWNFPLAILTGMAIAALVTGNTVIIKPAEQSSLIAGHFFDLLKKAGLPDGVAQFLPGQGEVVGQYLVQHPEVDIIVFTGSKKVGLQILNQASVVHPNQKHIKRCITELGGKNAIIIDSDADLDEAILGVIYSAFGFQGQKCSACSRVIVIENIYEKFVDRLIEATRSLKIGFAENSETFIGPVIDEEAQHRIRLMIDKAKTECTLLYEGSTPSEGFFIPPTIFACENPNTEIAQEEIFGPVLTVLKAIDLTHAVKMANETQYGLTGGVYSRSPSHIEKVKRELEVGNLYINRGITGALVERHPFGGFKMSGIGSKAGGPDYLLQFVEPRCITENTMRRGFAPLEDEKLD